MRTALAKCVALLLKEAEALFLLSSWFKDLVRIALSTWKVKLATHIFLLLSYRS